MVIEHSQHQLTYTNSSINIESLLVVSIYSLAFVFTGVRGVSGIDALASLAKFRTYLRSGFVTFPPGFLRI